jgi:hypothetical protein
MAGPWEQYAQATPQAQDGPWAKYSAPVTDLPAVHASLDPADDPRGFIPPRQVPEDGKSLLNVVKSYYPEWDDKKAAREVAAYYEKQGVPKQDFYRTSGLDKELLGYEIGRAPDPTEGMSFGERFAAGAGKAITDAYQGAKQLGTEVLREGLGDRTGLTQSIAQEPLTAVIDQQRADVAETRKLDAPLMATGGGMAGNITGNVGLLVAPGAALKGAALVPQLVRAAPALEAGASALLPTTVRGSALSGGGFAATQPAVTEQERAGNIGIGVTGGAVGAAVPRLASAATGAVRRLSPAFTAGQQERAAAGVIENFAQDPDAVRAALQRQNILVPGSLPTTAEASEDLGLFGLNRTLANTPDYGAEIGRRGIANNQARVKAIESEFGVTPTALDDAVADRNLTAKQTLKPIGTISVGDTKPVAQAVARLIEKNKASPTVTGVLEQVQSMIPNIKTVQDAHLVRQELANLMSGNIEGKANGKLAQKELIVVRDVLDRQMRQAFPEWGKFLKEYKGASREIGQIQTGEALLDRGGAVRDALGNNVLTPASFSRAAGDMDRTVAQATGFKKATAAGTLTPEQQGAVESVRQDLERFARSQTQGRAVGSNTMQNLIGGNTLQSAVGPVGAAAIEPISGIALLGLNGLRKSYGEKVAGIVEEAMLDPQRAAEILSKLPPKSRRMLTKQFVELMNQSGSVAGRSAPASE